MVCPIIFARSNVARFSVAAAEPSQNGHKEISGQIDTTVQILCCQMEEHSLTIPNPEFEAKLFRIREAMAQALTAPAVTSNGWSLVMFPALHHQIPMKQLFLLPGHRLTTSLQAENDLIVECMM